MFSHVFLGTNDFEDAFAFYTPLMALLGHELKFVERDQPWAGWMQPGIARPLFLLGTPYDGCRAEPGNGPMVAFLAPSRERVDAAYAAALTAGATDEGSPGLRPHYHRDYYGAYVRDLDGNKLCFCCHDPAG